METNATSTSERGTGKYLVLADEGADGGALLESLHQVIAQNRETTFVLLVPAKPAPRSLTWTEGESLAAARDTANAASRRLQQAGIRVVEALIGDASPVQAIADVLAQRGSFHGIIISTQPGRVSRWLKLDVLTIARKRFPLPVISANTPREALATA